MRDLIRRFVTFPHVCNKHMRERLTHIQKQANDLMLSYLQMCDWIWRCVAFPHTCTSICKSDVRIRHVTHARATCIHTYNNTSHHQQRITTHHIYNIIKHTERFIHISTYARATHATTHDIYIAAHIYMHTRKSNIHTNNNTSHHQQHIRHITSTTAWNKHSDLYTY